MPLQKEERLVFTKVSLQNFRSFDNIEFDLRSRGGSAKPLVVVYGENGAGKSALMSAFVLLQEIQNTMNVRDFYERILAQEDLLKSKEGEEKIRQRLARMRTIENIIDDCRMIGCNDSIVAEYEFQIDGHMGRYLVELNQTEIVHERLEFLLSKRKGVYFDCNGNNIFVNRGIVADDDLYTDIMAAVKRFWGKHSILAVVLHEISDKSTAFGREKLSEHFADVLDEFVLLSSYVELGSRRWSGLATPFSILDDPISGEVQKKDETQLDIMADAFSHIFSAISSTVDCVYYEREYGDQTIYYRLFIRKRIAGSYRNIPFSRESTGNCQLLDTLCFIFLACMGATVIIDEADAGIHDLLFKTIIEEIYPIIRKQKGQLIMTTHNTLLMETDFARDATYIIQEDEMGCKTIKCITSYGKRTYATNNVRSKYLNGDYRGIPVIKKKMDLSGLIGTLESLTEIADGNDKNL